MFDMIFPHFKTAWSHLVKICEVDDTAVVTGAVKLENNNKENTSYQQRMFTCRLDPESTEAKSP
jgi:hypothetical protein